MIIGTFILDFQTIAFEPDATIARKLLEGYQEIFKAENAFAIDEPVERAGWSFAKLFISGEFVEKIYEVERSYVEKSKGKKFEDKFVFWFNSKLKEKGCGANIKIAPEMKDPGF